ncbi:hypothetical protein GmRootV116_55520 (plasmid) [Variovorax sp. V116]
MQMLFCIPSDKPACCGSFRTRVSGIDGEMQKAWRRAEKPDGLPLNPVPRARRLSAAGAAPSQPVN